MFFGFGFFAVLSVIGTARWLTRSGSLCLGGWGAYSASQEVGTLEGDLALCGLCFPPCNPLRFTTYTPGTFLVGGYDGCGRRAGLFHCVAALHLLLPY